MMKKVIAWLLIIATTAAITVGGTLAYLTDRDSEANVFTVGDVKIDLNEDFQQGAELIPGVDIKKEATITNTGKNDAYVWLTVLLPVEMGPYTAPSDMTASNNVVHWNYPAEAAENMSIKFNPTPVEVDTDGDGVVEKYYQTDLLWKNIVKPGETTGTMMNKVYMDTHVDIDPDGNMHWVVGGETTDLNWNVNEKGNPVIYVSAYAIQTEGFDTVEAAYEAYQTQWGSNGGEYSAPPKLATTIEDIQAVCKTGGKVILANDIIVDANTKPMTSDILCLINGKNVTLDLNGYNLIIEEDAKQLGSTFFIGNPGGHLNIVGDGGITVENGKAPIVWVLQTGTANIYGGTFTSNSAANEAICYSQSNGGVIHVYGGKFVYDLHNTQNGGFNVRDSGVWEMRIMLHEGVLLSRPEYSQHLQGTNNGEEVRIKLEDGCVVEAVEIDGETWYQVVKK